MSALDRLLEQIDAFIKKYYKNQIVKGVIWFVGIFVLSLLLVSTLEYFGRFNSTVRGVLFFSFIAVNLYVLIQYFIIPGLKLFSFGKRINNFQAASIIGKFFPDVSDRLTNTLQLNQNLDQHDGSIELAKASVNQRAKSLSVVPFSNAIAIKENLRYLKYVGPVLLLFLLLFLFLPALFKDGTKRLVNYSQHFAVQAPFDFHLQNFKSTIVEGESVPINLELQGSVFPEKVYVVSQQGKFLLERVSRNRFKGELANILSSTSFYFEANEFKSAGYTINVVGKPSIGKLTLTVGYPKYLGKKSETIKNTGDILVPEGAQVRWSIVSKNTQKIGLAFKDTTYSSSSHGLKASKTIRHSEEYALFYTGEEVDTTGTTNYLINCIKDQYPSISVIQKEDSIQKAVRYFNGKIADDYGLTSLRLVYTIISKDGKKRKETLRVQPVSGTQSNFDYAVDFSNESLQPEDKIEYYFVVNDNDGVNGSKTTTSQRMLYKAPSTEELAEKHEETQEKAKEDLNKLIQKAQTFKKDVNRLQKDMLNNSNSDWNKSNEVQRLKQEHQSLMKSIDDTKKSLNQSNEEVNQLTEQEKELLEKQEMLQDLLDEVMDDELKELLEELEKLLEENNKEKMQQNMDELELSSEELNKELDRSMEMLKRLQVDEKIDGIEEKLKKLSEEQESLKEIIQEKKLEKETSVEEQKEIDKKFDQVKEDIEELKKLNKELDRPVQLPNTSEEEKEIDESLEDAEENLEKGKENKAGESQQNASDKMQEMAQDMDEAQKSSEQQQQSEDMEMLREILESLVTLSKDQEWVKEEMGNTDSNDPVFRSYGRFQRKVNDNTVPVKDSLEQLAIRQPKTAKFIDKELRNITVNQSLTMDDIDERRKRQLEAHQQLTMTSFNNLALLLNESLQQMQQQMQNMMPGAGSCNKPGGAMPKPGKGMSPGNMKKMLQKQLDELKKGEQEGGKKPGKKGQNGQKGMNGMGNQKIAKMAAEQSLIRKRLEQLRNELNKKGKGEGNSLNPLIEKLKEQEEDLINKKHNSELIHRQKEILTRLLESEKALMERGFEEKRKSTTGKKQEYGNKIQFNEYNKEKLKQIEILRAIDPIYNKYYKDKATEYFNAH